MDQQRGAAPTELELYRMRMNQTTDDSEQTGAATMVKLSEQGEQLQRTETNMDGIHADVKKAERNLEELDKCCGLCLCPWNKAKKHRSDKLFKPRRIDVPDNTAKYNTGQAQSANPNSHAVQNQQPTIPGQGQFVTRITDDAREDEMENNLQYASNAVSGLKLLATDMNQEIRTQNVLLERIDKKAEANQKRIDAAQKRADHIVG